MNKNYIVCCDILNITFYSDKKSAKQRSISFQSEYGFRFDISTH